MLIDRDELPEHRLEALRDLRVTGPQTPGHAVMTRGRQLRRRRRQGGGAVLAGVAVAGTVLATPLSPFGTAGGRQHVAGPAATPAPVGTTPAPLPDACDQVTKPRFRPEQVPQLLHLVRNPSDPIVFADFHQFNGCVPAAWAGADLSGGTVERSWALRGPMAEGQIGVPAGGRATTVRGGRGQALDYQGDGYVSWREGGRWWTFEGHGIRIRTLLPMVERLRITGSTVDPASLPAADLRASKPDVLGGGEPSWSVTYGNVNEDAGGWTLNVSQGTGDAEPAPYSAWPGDELRAIGGHQVLLGTGALRRAVWTAGGLTFSITGDLSRAETIQAVRNVVQVRPDDPRVREALRQRDVLFPPEPEAEPTGAPEPTGTGGAQPSRTGDPEPSETGLPEPSSTGDPEPSETGWPEPTWTGLPTPTSPLPTRS